MEEKTELNPELVWRLDKIDSNIENCKNEEERLDLKLRKLIR